MLTRYEEFFSQEKNPTRLAKFLSCELKITLDSFTAYPPWPLLFTYQLSVRLLVNFVSFFFSARSRSQCTATPFNFYQIRGFFYVCGLCSVLCNRFRWGLTGKGVDGQPLAAEQRRVMRTLALHEVQRKRVTATVVEAMHFYSQASLTAPLMANKNWR